MRADSLRLDHLAVSGATLDAAAGAVEEALGLALQPGGRHARYGTHNRLMGLVEGLYLEAIAVDPEAAPPADARWFDLDRRDGPPRLTNWIVATDDLDAACAALPGIGRPVELERGDLRWRMAVPEDGVLPFDNLHPAVMEWQSGLHPARRLPASGGRLVRLTVSHPDAAALRDRLAPLLQDARVVFADGAPGLSAEVDTPSGLRVLG